jgi:hypothetical protein
VKQRKATAASRLVDITVEEVSLVDRAANNRTFLLVKRSDAMLNGDEDLNPVELEAEEDEESADEPAAADEAKKAEPWAPILEAIAGVTTRLDSLLAPAAGEDAKRPKPAEPTDDRMKPRPKPAEPTDPKLRTVLDEISSAMTKIVETVKAQAGRLTTLEKATTPRASVEESGGREPAGVGWPLDMNRLGDRPTKKRDAAHEDFE